MTLPFDPYPDGDDPLDPRDWSEIYDTPDDHTTGGARPALDGAYVDIHDGMRVYDGDVYFAIEGGWVALDDVVAAMRDYSAARREDARE